MNRHGSFAETISFSGSEEEAGQSSKYSRSLLLPLFPFLALLRSWRIRINFLIRLFHIGCCMLSWFFGIVGTLISDEFLIDAHQVVIALHQLHLLTRQDLILILQSIHSLLQSFVGVLQGTYRNVVSFQGFDLIFVLSLPGQGGILGFFQSSLELCNLTILLCDLCIQLSDFIGGIFGSGLTLQCLDECLLALDDFRHFCQTSLQFIVLLLPFLQNFLQLYDDPQFLLFRDLRLCEQLALFRQVKLGLSDQLLIELSFSLKITDSLIFILQLPFQLNEGLFLPSDFGNQLFNRESFLFGLGLSGANLQRVVSLLLQLQIFLQQFLPLRLSLHQHCLQRGHLL